MSIETLERRVERLENKLQEVESRLTEQTPPKKRGWRWFVGINADDPDFEEVVRIGQEWRNADRPIDVEDNG